MKGLLILVIVALAWLPLISFVRHLIFMRHNRAFDIAKERFRIAQYRGNITAMQAEHEQCEAAIREMKKIAYGDKR